MPPAMVTKYLPENMRGTAFGILSTTAAIGMILGAPLGGIITGYCSWRWAFLINIPIGLLAIYIAKKTLPGDNVQESRKSSGGFDTFGAFFSFIATINFFYALSMIGVKAWTSPVIIACMAISVISIFFFIKWEKRHLNPLVDLALFKNRTFVAENVSCALAYAFLAGNNFIMPFYLQAFQGLSPQKTGMVFILYSLVYMVTGPVVGKLLKIVKARTLCSAAMFFAAAAIFGFTFFFKISSLIPVCVFFACNGFAMATFGTANNTSVMDSAPKGKEGMVAGILRMMMRLGMAVGICVFEMVFSRAILDHGSAPGNNLASLPPEQLSSGFFYSLITAGILCLIAAILPLLSDKNRIK
jgi:MFS family permease